MRSVPFAVQGLSYRVHGRTELRQAKNSLDKISVFRVDVEIRKRVRRDGDGHQNPEICSLLKAQKKRSKITPP